MFQGTTDGLAPWQRLDQAGLDSNENNDGFGSGVQAGDFDGDGLDDLAVGAAYEDINGIENVGAVFLFHGGEENLSPWTKIIDQGELDANGAVDGFGKHLGAGDLNGDGVDDLLVGAPDKKNGNIFQAGKVYLFRGTESGPVAWTAFNQTSHGEAVKENSFGWSLGTGDFDRDGIADLAVGAIYPSGSVFTYRGNPNAIPSDGQLLSQETGEICYGEPKPDSDPDPDPDPDPEPQERTFVLTLEAEVPYEGIVSYSANWPGVINSYLKEIEVVEEGFGKWLLAHFVKHGHPRVCSENTTVTLENGVPSTPEQIREIFGTSKPRFPLFFNVACVELSQYSPEIRQGILVKITYVVE